MTATLHSPGVQRGENAARQPAMSQFYRLYHLGSEAESPKAADIEIQDGVVIAAHPALAFMIGWAIEKVLEKLVKYEFKFSRLPGASRTSLFVTEPPSEAQRGLEKAARVKPEGPAKTIKPAERAKPSAAAKPPVKQAKIVVPMPAATPAGKGIPSSMASLPRTVFSMGKRV